MAFFAVLLNASFGYSRGQSVQADRFQEEGDSVRFYQGERLVYQAPTEYVREIQQFENQPDCDRFFQEARRRHREGGNLSLQEVGPIRRSKSLKAKPGQGGVPAESISLRVEEIGLARKK
ncbi:MAG: hypothetical protein JW797_02390 [Bradymonadales bacterium]|nr:hypothetical protein [Bradymonadales bacterium]